MVTADGRRCSTGLIASERADSGRKDCELAGGRASRQGTKEQGQKGRGRREEALTDG